MCGIVGYIGKKNAQPVLLDGLRRLEYRGYDSAGIAVRQPDGFSIYKTTERIQDLTKRLGDRPVSGGLGIGHTRWATHGAVSEANAHPHIGGEGVLALVHNGVIENYRQLRASLERKGYVFQSETDTEVVAHLIADTIQKPLADTGDRDIVQTLFHAVDLALSKLQGTFGIALILRDYPNLLVSARVGSPLVIGVGSGEYYLASDSNAISRYTRQIVYMNDHEIAILTHDDLHIFHRENGRVEPDIQILAKDEGDADLGRYPHYMLKEIFEQPESIRNAMRGRIDPREASAHFGGLNLTPKQLNGIDRIILTGCGTSWHAALIGEYLIEELARIPVEVEYASEFRYRNAPVDRNTLVLAVTQSGETADTLAALRESKRKGLHTLSICNVVGSSIAREADGGIYLHAGPEIGVASTKAFTSQVSVLLLLALYLGRMRHLSFVDGQKIINSLNQIPSLVERSLQANDAIHAIAQKYQNATNMLYLGRHYNFPVALEGALKLKEVSYLHAEGYPAAEMKHGPIALVDEKTPSIFIAPRGVIYDKVMNNLEEIKARGGPVIAIASEGDAGIRDHTEDVVFVPEVEDYLQPLITVIPLQLLAYHTAVLRGCDVDKPRNLAKSVTVE